ncbi:SAM-dependent methyltransferase [Pseudonocardia acaciae]|uniref:SAM-dependent methyltransferase n=1 Tax=Pseudonocardia acaciae TaxID=551276 RepID=UPI00048DB034|nr:SAM-dependent methyltransferase [Pseudonocardia acaciae]
MPDHEPAVTIRYDVAQSARIWNYWMGGKDNYPADRAAGEAVLEQYPEMAELAKACRQFIIRTVRYLAGEAGVRQFLDIGTGLPTMQNTHEVAQGLAPDSRVVYVDNDPVVLAHARALLTNTTPEGVTTYVDADYNDTSLLIADARNVLNFNEPIAVMFMGVLGHTEDFERALGIARRVMDAVPSGSYLAQYEGTDTSRAYVEACATEKDLGVAYYPRSPEQVAAYFEGLKLVEPGVVEINAWRPAVVGDGPPRAVPAYGGVARKP